MVLKGMAGILTGTILGGETNRIVGSISDFPSGLKGATQNFVSLGVVGNAARKAKESFRFL